VIMSPSSIRLSTIPFNARTHESKLNYWDAMRQHENMQRSSTSLEASVNPWFRKLAMRRSAARSH
jgi:hypothetical protein